MLKISINDHTGSRGKYAYALYSKINSVNQESDGFKTKIREMEERVKLVAKPSRERQWSVTTAEGQIAGMISNNIALPFKYNSLQITLKEGEPQLLRHAAGENGRDAQSVIHKQFTN